MIMTIYSTVIVSLMRRMELLLNLLPMFIRRVNQRLPYIVQCTPTIGASPLRKVKRKHWPNMLGASSKGHGPKAPIKINKTKEHGNHPIMKDMPDGWMTPEGELYNVQEVYEGTKVLAYGNNGENKAPKEPQACVWVNTHGKGKVFATTIGHHNSTMSTKEYLDMLGNAVRWVTAK